MNELTKEQIFQDVARQAKDYANMEGITDPIIIGHIMEGIRLGMARGLEIARNIHSKSAEKTQENLDDLPF